MTKSQAGRLGGRPSLPTYHELRGMQLMVSLDRKEGEHSNNLKELKRQFKMRMVPAEI